MVGYYPQIYKAYLGAVVAGLVTVNAALAFNPAATAPLLLLLGSSAAKAGYFHSQWSSDPDLEEEIRVAVEKAFAKKTVRESLAVIIA